MLRESEDIWDGGTSIMQPINFTSTPNAGRWAGGTAVIPTTTVEIGTAAEFVDRNYYASVTLAKTVVAKNRGKARIIDLVKAQIENAEASLRDTMGVDVFLDGSGATPGLDGLNAIILFGSGTYGGITRVGASGSKTAPVGNGFWNSTPLTAGGGAVTRWKGSIDQQGATTLTLLLMQSAFGAVSQNNEFPTLIVTSQPIYNKYWALLTSIQRQVSSEMTGMAGFKYLVFNDVPVVVDDNIDSQSAMYFLNLDHLYWRPLEGGNFDTTPFLMPVGQLTMTKVINWQGNMTCDRPNLQCKLSSIT
jgi:hypothetical protein